MKLKNAHKIDQVLIHRANKIFNSGNFAITMSYFAVGVTTSFISTPLNIYLVNELNAEPQIQTTIGILATLPWSFKLVFGFLSDVVPINGQHRKPYLTIGALIYSISFIAYALQPAAHQNVIVLAFAIFVGTMGMIMMDVMADTMCVERSRFEPEEIRGQMQSSYYSIRFGGSLIGSIAGALVSNKEAWGWGLTFPQVALINGLIPFLLVTPWLLSLREKYKKVVHVHHDLDLALTSPKVSSSSPKSFNNYGSTGSSTHSNRNYDVSEEDTSHLLQFKLERAAAQVKGVSMISLSPSRGMPDTYRSMDDLDSLNTFSSKFDKQQSRLEEGRGLPPLATGNPSPRTQQLQAFSGSSFSSRSPKAALRSPKYVKRVMAPVSEKAFVEDLDEEDTEPLSPLSKQCLEIWNTVQLTSVWRPMTFVYIFNLLQVPDVAWQSYLQLSLHFEPWLLGGMVVMGSFMTFAGVLAYKYIFFKASWRKIYLWSVVLTTFFSLLQLVLIFQINTKYLHIKNVFFSMGDDVITAYISGIQFLPLCIMYMKLCPDGAEGASYSILTTFGNIALVCGQSLGNIAAGIWDVSNNAMRENNVSGLWKLHVFTSLVSLLPLSLLFLLPHNEKDQEELGKSKERSRLGGIVFLTVLTCSLLWTLSEAALTLYQCYSTM